MSATDWCERVNPMSGQVSKKTGKASQAKKASAKRQPKPHVISLRVSEREKQLLEQISQRRDKSVSTVVREVLERWLAR